MWFAAQGDHKFCAGAYFGTHSFVGYDQGRSRQDLLCNNIERFLRNCDPVKRRLCALDIGRDCLEVFVASFVCGAGAICLVCASIGLSVYQRHQAPLYVSAAALHCSEDIRTDWTVGIADDDRNFHYRLESLAHVKALGLSADKNGHWLKVARGFA